MDNHSLLGPPVLHITKNAVRDILENRRRQSSLKESIKNLFNSYTSYSLRHGNGDIDFDDPTNQACYVFLYFPALCYGTLHGLLLCRRYLTTVLEKTSMDYNCLKVCALGGGPGTDLFGVRMFLNHTGYEHVQIKATVLDRYPEWRFAFQHLLFQLYNPSCISAKYIHLDANNHRVDQFQINSIADADLITCSKFISAVRALPNSEENILAVLRNVKPDAYIFYMDNSKGGNTEYFRSVATSANCTEITCFVQDGNYQFRLPKTEHPVILQELSRSFNFNSQRNLRVTFMVWKKNRTSPISKYRTPDSSNLYGSTRQRQTMTSGLRPQEASICYSQENMRATTHGLTHSYDSRPTYEYNQLRNSMRDSVLEAQPKSYVPQTESMTRRKDTRPLSTEGASCPPRLHHGPFTSSRQGIKTIGGCSQVRLASLAAKISKSSIVQTRSAPHRKIVTYATHPPKTQSEPHSTNDYTALPWQREVWDKSIVLRKQAKRVFASAVLNSVKC